MSNDLILKNNLALRLEGEKIHPGSLSCHAIAEILSLYESLICYFHLDNGGKKANIFPKSMNEGSLVFNFAVEDSQLLENASNLLETLSEKNFSKISAKVQKKLKEIVSFNRRKKCKVYIAYNDKEACIDEKLLDVGTIEGETEICGVVMFVGGKKPIIRIQQTDGKKIKCNVSEDLVKNIAKNLYQKVVLNGVACWDKSTHELIKFKVNNFRVINDFGAAFENLKKSVGNIFDDVDDVDSFISKIRRGE